MLGYKVSIKSFLISFLLCFTLNADYSSGFGGKYGVQADRVDKSAVGFDYQGKTEKHESQKGEYTHVVGSYSDVVAFMIRGPVKHWFFYIYGTPNLLKVNAV